MGHPRSRSVDPLRTGIYHCTSRCVRRASLIESSERCRWIISALHRLCRIFAIDVCDFAVMRNHVHLLLRTHPELAMTWPAREVARRWLCRNGRVPEDLAASIDEACDDPDLIEDWRSRLSDLGWFHKLWKEPAAKAWNLEDEVTGHFWAGRFHSVGCHDESSTLMQATYILLNPVHCGMERIPGESGRTSLSLRIARLEDAIKSGELRGGVEAYRAALLEPAIACDPGPDAPRMTDAEWATRLARSSQLRSLREEAVAKAYGSLRTARRSFTSHPAGVDADTVKVRRREAVPPARTSFEHGGLPPEASLGTSDRMRRERSAPMMDGNRRRNPWRGRTSLSVVQGCTLLDFIEFVDDRSRIPRADKACHVPRGSPRIVDQARKRLKAQGILLPQPRRRRRQFFEDSGYEADAGLGRNRMTGTSS